ncbi:MAG: hypothetical protein OEZ22_07155 [Spirochaetia bacterium]|nr:hypothetical protein [Spirochaetia bacterium]
MLKQIFSDIWRNKIARTGFFVAIFLISFSNIIQYRFQINNFINSFFKPHSFDNPDSFGNTPYGFEEDIEEALETYKTGLEKLIEESYDLYNYDIPEEIFEKKIDLNINWQKGLNRDSLEKVYYLFSDLSLFCKPVTETDSVSTEWQRKEKLKKRKLRLNKTEKTSPFDFALKEDDYENIRNYLFDLDRKYFSIAIGMKPDSLAIITFRETLLNALCKSSIKPKLWIKAIEYKEYYHEKKIFNEIKNQGKNTRDFMDEVYTKGLVNAKNDPYYISFLKSYFMASTARSENIQWKYDFSKNYYLLHKDKNYLYTYIESMLSKSRVSNIEENKLIFDELFKLEYPNIESDFSYVYALAETAFRAANYKKSRAITNNIIKHRLYNNKTEYSHIKRIDFMLELSGY